MSAVVAPLPPESVHAQARPVSAPAIADPLPQRLAGLDGVVLVAGLPGAAALVLAWLRRTRPPRRTEPPLRENAAHG